MGDPNKPTTKFGSAFTARLAEHRRVAYRPVPKSSVLVTMVIDELLVGAAALKNGAVRKKLREVGAVNTGHEVLEGFKNAPVIHIFRLRKLKNGAYRHLAGAVWQVREELVKAGIPPEQVGPNHVLIPAANDYHTCPWGPPDEVEAKNFNPMPKKIDVLVIDAGYVPSPSLPAKTVDVAFGEWFRNGGGWKAEGVKVAGAKDPLNQNGDGFLDALVGHANFVAGIVLRACPAARVKIVSHNGALVAGAAATPLPTEASVARSLWKYGRIVPQSGRLVVNVGYAFATLPRSVKLLETGAGGPPSWTFGAVLAGLPDSTLVVAPAGNQGSAVKQYPAAFPDVIGVGSVGPAGQRASKWSNFGPWVDCSTQGGDVVSTFITGWTNRPTEERVPKGKAKAGTRPPKTFSTGWAVWSGTSFAAPKVAAAIATEQLTNPTGSLQDAWGALKTFYSGASTPKVADMGTVMSGLPPVV